jgi:glycosyltransferase involved in cell wall biosynthesis
VIPRKLNIVIFNADYFGSMADSLRVRNLFEPLSESKFVSLQNLAINIKSPNFTDNYIRPIGYKNLKYNIRNPLSILFFIFASIHYLLKTRQQSYSNIIYCYSNPSLENIFILIIAKIFRYKIVFDVVEDFRLFHDIKSATKRMKIKIYSLKRMEFLIPILGSICFAITKHLVAKYSTYSKKGFSVYYLPISTQIDKILSYKITTEKKEIIKVFYGGTFGSKDGIRFLIEGFECVCTKISNIELILTGKGNTYNIEILKNRIETSKYKNRISYIGFLSQEDYYKVMVNSDILCMVRENSEYANAGFPFKLGEYLASGNAVIATNVGDINDYLENDKNAIIIEPESSNEICNATLKLILNSDLRHKIGHEGQKAARQYFDANMISEKLFSILVDL